MFSFLDFSLKFFFFFFNDTATTEIYTLSLHDALPISAAGAATEEIAAARGVGRAERERPRERALHADIPVLIARRPRSEEHTSELQSLRHLVCRLLLEKKKIKKLTKLSIDLTFVCLKQ